jgi:hypothetical protein
MVCSVDPFIEPIFLGSQKEYKPFEAEKVAQFIAKVASEEFWSLGSMFMNQSDRRKLLYSFKLQRG